MFSKQLNGKCQIKKLLCIVLVMMVVGSVSADRWVKELVDTLYQTTGNWQDGKPVSRSGQFGFILDEKVNFGNDEGIIVVRGGIFCDPRNIYQTASNTLIVLDATLDYSEGWANVGRGRTTDADHLALMIVAEGVVNAPSTSFKVPLAWEPRDGTDEIDAMFGRLNLYGGVLTAQDIAVAADAWGDGVLDIRGGVLRQTNDDTDQVQQDIDDGKIIAYSGYPGASLTHTYDALANQTIVKALSGLNPSPANHADGVDAAKTALTWTDPAPGDPNFAGLKKYVYLGENAGWPDYDDPNVHLAMQDRDYRATYIPRPDIPLVESDDTDNSTPVSLDLEKEYWWIVDYGVDDANVAFTYIFKFDTKNTAPEVAAGYNQYSFLDGGSRTITLDGSFTRDDNNPAAATPIWTVISALTPYEIPDDDPVAIDPNDYSFVGDDNNQLNSQFEVLTAGTYILELDADDGEYTAPFPQEVTLFIRDTACKAAIIFPEFEFLAGDTNGDCVVDLNDMADVGSTWLDDNALDGTTEYIPPEE